MAERGVVFWPWYATAAMLEHFPGLAALAESPGGGTSDLEQDPVLTAWLECQRTLGTRPLLRHVTQFCEDVRWAPYFGPHGLPCTVVEHTAASTTGAEKARLLTEDQALLERVRTVFHIPGWPILPLKTILLSLPDGRYVLFTGRVEDSFDDYRRALGAQLGLSGSKAKSIRPAQVGDTVTLLGMAPGTIGPLLEPPYWKNVAAIFLISAAFPEEALVEIPITRRYGLLIWSTVLQGVLEQLGAQGREAGHPAVYVL